MARRLIRRAALGVGVGLAMALLQVLWVETHLGTRAQFDFAVMWTALGVLVAVFLGFMVRFYLREYVNVWFRGSKEEDHGIQR